MKKTDLILTSNDGVQSGPTGYDRLAFFLEHAEELSCRRTIPVSFAARAVRKVRSLLSASAWVMPSSHQLEKTARNRIRKGDVGLVHMFWGDRDWGRLDLFCRQRRIPFVVTVHACPGDLPTIFKDAGRLKNVAAYILMSAHQKPFFLERGVPPDRLHVIHHGVDTHFFTPDAAATKKTGTFTLVSVGHTHRNFSLLKAVIERLEKCSGCRFHVITREDFRAEFAAYKNIFFESNISNEELRAAYTGADALMLTADDSTANNALMEAMACGLPVIGERVGGIPEYVSASCALLSPANDLNALAGNIERVMNDEALQRSMRQAARCRAEELAWEVVARATQDLYQQVKGVRGGD